MDDEIVCPGCATRLSRRQLLSTSNVIESCPKCGDVVRKSDGFSGENVAAITAEDVSAIETWLAEESEALKLECRANREKEGSGHYRWQVTGSLLADCPPNWVIEIIHTTRTPGILKVRLTASEQRLLPDGLTRSLIGVFRDHGLQPHGERTQSSGISGSRQETRWGAQQYLNTNSLSQGLMRPVVLRLIGAMRDAKTTLESRSG